MLTGEHVELAKSLAEKIVVRFIVTNIVLALVFFIGLASFFGS